MKDITIKPSLFSFSIDLPLPRLDPFNQVLLSELSIRIADALQAPMSPERFRLRVGDALFSYDLYCSFFSDNVDVRKTAERVTLTFKNGRIRGDLDFIFVRVARFLEAFASGHGQVVAFSGFCHGLCSSTESRDSFLNQFAVEKSVTGPGLTGRVKVGEWTEPIKVLAEASFILPGGLFILWETVYTNLGEVKSVPGDQYKKVSERIPRSFEAAAAVFGLKLEYQETWNTPAT